MSDDGMNGDANPREFAPPKMLPRRTQRDLQKLRSRRLLQQVGRRIFADGGFLTASVEEIAAAAGVSRATFYLHYKSKHALLSEILNRQMSWNRRRYRALRLSQPPRCADFADWLRSFTIDFDNGREAIALFNFASSLNPQFMQIAAIKRDEAVLMVGRRNPALRIFGANGAIDEARRISLNLLLLEVEQFASQAALGVWCFDVEVSIRLLSGRLLDFTRTPH